VAARAHGGIGGRRPKLGPQQQAAIVEMVHTGQQSQADRDDDPQTLSHTERQPAFSRRVQKDSADSTADCKRKRLKAGGLKPRTERPVGGRQPPVGKSRAVDKWWYRSGHWHRTCILSHP
jgi:hypothetical protein